MPLASYMRGHAGMENSTMFFTRKTPAIIDAAKALPGRAKPIATAESHFVNGNPLKGPTRKAARPRFSRWAASGALNACSGRCRAFG